MKVALSKRQLRYDMAALDRFIGRYGNISLIDAHDCVSIELDFLRGDCINHKRKNENITDDNKEILEWI